MRLTPKRRLRKTRSKVRIADRRRPLAAAASAAGGHTTDLLAAIAASAGEAIIGVRLTGRVFAWNAAAAQLHGRAAREMLGRSVFSAYPRESREALRAILAQAGRGVFTPSFETLVRRGEAAANVSLAVSPVRGHAGRVLGASIIARDISARKRSDDTLSAAVQAQTAELASANQQLRFQVEQRKRAEALLAGEKRILALIATGASVEDALGAICHAVAEHSPGSRCAIRVLPEDPRREPPRLFGDPLLSGIPLRFPDQPERPAFVENVAASPTLRSWAARARFGTLRTEPVLGSAGQLLALVMIARDAAADPLSVDLETAGSAARLAAIVIEKARAEETAQRQFGQLAHVARLATMGEMASGLAHELNQPLCAIVNFTEACVEMLAARSADAELRQAMIAVAQQAERAGEVIRRLREFVRRREPQRSPLDVNQTVREVMSLTAAETRQREVSLRLQLADGLPPVLADAIHIQQVILNLVRNAVDAMQDTPPARRRLLIQTRKQRGFAEVSVRDWGRGLGGEAAEHVFESFFTTKTDGMGMGLSISRSIIEVHEGRIWATPHAGRGTTFHFTLPLASAETP